MGNERYQLLPIIGSGSFATVYRARDTETNKIVALKVLKKNANQSEKERFQKEFEIIRSLNHKNIVEVFDFEQDKEGCSFIAMELVSQSGDTIKKLLDAKDCLNQGEALQLITQVTEGVAHAHKANIIHRDLKPTNILLTTDGVPKVADFGVAKILHLRESNQLLTKTGELIGTPQYMAPEQKFGQHNKIGKEADVWALGAILYELLSGIPAFSTKEYYSGYNSFHRVRQRPLHCLNLKQPVSVALSLIVETALRRRQSLRYQDAHSLLTKLKEYEQQNSPSTLDRIKLIQNAMVRSIDIDDYVLQQYVTLRSLKIGLISFLAISLSVLVFLFFLNREAGSNDPTLKKITQWSITPVIPSATTAVAPHPTKDLIAIGTDDGAISLCDANFKLITNMGHHSTHIRNLKWSPNGQWLASSSDDNSLRLWKNDGSSGPVFDKHQQQIDGLDWNISSNKLISCCAESSLVRITDIHGQQLAKFKANDQGVSDVSWCKSTGRIATIGSDRQLRIFSNSGKLRHELGKVFNEELCRNIHWSSKGELLLGGRFGSIGIWNENNGFHRVATDAGQVTQLRWSPDGESFAVCVQGAQGLLYNRSGIFLRRLGETNGNTSVAWFQNSKKLLIVGASLQYWDTTSGIAGITLETKGQPINNVVVSPDGLVATVSGNNVAIWDKGGKIKSVISHDSTISNCKWNPDGQSLLVSSEDRVVRIWSIEGKRLSSIESFDTPITSVCWTKPDENQFITRTLEGRVSIWSENGQLINSFLSSKIIGCPSIRFRPNTKLLSFLDLKNLNNPTEYCIRTTSLNGKTESVYDKPFEIYCFAWSSTGDNLVIAGPYGRMVLWNVKTKFSQRLNTGHQRSIRKVSFSPSDKLFASASDNNIVQVWNSDPGTINSTIRHDSPVKSICWSPDELQIISGDQSGNVIVSDLNGKIINKLTGHRKSVNHIKWISDGSFLVTQDSREIRIWAMPECKVKWIGIHASGNHVASFDSNGKVISGDAQVLLKEYVVKVKDEDGKQAILSFDQFQEMQLKK